ncbi:MAG: sensor domain-containing diguanylate cyclase [Anaerolineales bacterium]
MDKKQTLHRAQAFEHLFEAVILTDPGGAILDCNPAAERVFGYLAEELDGKSISMLIADDNAEAIAADILTQVEKHGAWRGELRKLGSRNQTGIIEVVASPLRGVRGHFEGATWIVRDITDRMMLEKRIKALEYYDTLTGVPNRFVMYDRLQQMITTARRNQLMFALFLVDLDDFQKINDAGGYSAGDAVLREAAERMQSVLRQSDTVARAGGDEFIVIAADIRQERDADVVRENIQAAFRGQFLVGGAAYTVSASVGAAIYPRDGETSDDLLMCADKALAREKLARRESRTDE